ncbi:MAG TPA: alpha/beta fold hydrolase [Candidatus Binatia bacterium]|nr:alpha/beta fold hydrolase [Candidatus Binatia bacterium]
MSAGTRPASVRRPRTWTPYRIDRLVADVVDLAAAAGYRGSRRFHLVGHDWGGQVAWTVAARHPDRIASLAVLSRPHPAAFYARSARTPTDSRSDRAITGRSTTRRRRCACSKTTRGDSRWRPRRRAFPRPRSRSTCPCSVPPRRSSRRSPGTAPPADFLWNSGRLRPRRSICGATWTPRSAVRPRWRRRNS